MSEYKCDKCDKIFIFKSNYIRHITRKTTCDDNIYICDKCDKIFKYKSKYDIHINKKISCIKQENDINQKISTIIKQNNEITNNKGINDIIKIDDINKIKCIECNKIFASEKSLKRHILNYCKSFEIINKSDLIQKIYELKKELNNKDSNKLDEININSKNHINVNNTVNNIIINAYGKEDLSHITEKDYKNIFNKCNSAIPMLIELVHFNEDKPENTNVYISNMKSQYAYVYDGKKWILKNKNELIDDIYDNKCIILLEKYDDLKNILNDQTIRIFEHFKTKYDTDDMKENVLNRIELVLYNNRNLIKK
jgi:uncharacterized C2H2 Zn-finger protein